MIRLGTSDTAREGVALEISNGGRRVTLRGGHSGILQIPPVHFSIEELLGPLRAVRLPPAPKRRRAMQAAVAGEIPT